MSAVAAGILTVLASVAAVSCMYQGMWVSAAVLGVVAWVLAYVCLRAET